MTIKVMVVVVVVVLLLLVLLLVMMMMRRRRRRSVSMVSMRMRIAWYCVSSTTFLLPKLIHSNKHRAPSFGQTS